MTCLKGTSLDELSAGKTCISEGRVWGVRLGFQGCRATSTSLVVRPLDATQLLVYQFQAQVDRSLRADDYSAAPLCLAGIEASRLLFKPLHVSKCQSSLTGEQRITQLQSILHGYFTNSVCILG